MQTPCRLHVTLARNAPVGVIFRRGPSEWYQLTKWNTQTDALDHGQWFRGRIYHREADLSPNGELLVYGARAEHNRARPGYMPSYGCLWTAVSRPPYFTALALWPCNYNPMRGTFEDDRTLWIGSREHHPNHPPTGLTIRCGTPPEEWFLAGGRMDDGWRVVQAGEWYNYGYDPARIVEREIPASESGYPRLASRVSEYASSGPVGEFAVRYRFAESDLPLPEVDWADWDHGGRLVYARAGCLYRKDARCGPDAPEYLIHDFNPARFRPLAAPDWATKW